MASPPPRACRALGGGTSVCYPLGMSATNQPDPPEFESVSPSLDVGDGQQRSAPVKLGTSPAAKSAELEVTQSAQRSLGPVTTHRESKRDDCATDSLELSPDVEHPRGPGT